jgi:hypothetical protein
MKSFSFVALVLATSPVFAQLGATASQSAAPVPAAAPTLFGQVNGRVICGDTDAPGRFASVQLVSEKPEQMGFSNFDPTKNPDFAKSLSVVFSTLLKGSNLSALAGIDGSFSLDKVPPGTYYVVAQLPGYQSALSQFSQAERMKADPDTLKAVQSSAEKIVVGPDQAAHVELRLERGSSLSGSVRYDDGSPASGVTPILISLQKDGKWKDLALSMVPTPTDDRGRFRFYGLPPGKYAVKAALPTTQASMGLGTGSMAMHMNLGDALVVYSGGTTREKDVKPVEVGSGDDVDGLEVIFPLSGLHAVAGTVVAKSDNHPVISGAIALLDSETKAVVRSAMLDREGGFRLNYVPEGQYTLKISGAADTEKSESPMEESDIGRMMSGKKIKSYGEAERTFTLKTDETTITLQVPDAHGKAPAGNPTP